MQGDGKTVVAIEFLPGWWRSFAGGSTFYQRVSVRKGVL
jgi:hypothetical protein